MRGFTDSGINLCSQSTIILNNAARVLEIDERLLQLARLLAQGGLVQEFECVSTQMVERLRFIFLQLNARPSFLQQFDRESSIVVRLIKPIVREKSHIGSILQISH